MCHALVEVIGSLPPATKLWCGHEYTVANLLFAQSVEPENVAIKEKLKEAQEKRRRGEPTVPSLVSEEKRFNPFMRVAEKTVKLAVGKEDDTKEDTMNKLREAKNSFKTPTH